MKQVMDRLFGTNGVRGIFGKELTLEFVLELAYSLATYYNDKPLLIGYDGRYSSPILSKILIAGLNYMGIDTYDAGLIPTPCLQYSIKELRYDGGIMITASHNPPEYNGIKVMSKDGVEVSRDEEKVIEDIYFNKRFKQPTRIGLDHKEDRCISVYLEGIKSVVDVELIKSKGFKVVLDLGNGVQALTAPRLLKELGCKVITINANIDGYFPGRGSEPTLDNLQELASKVKEYNADIGIAYDGDGDRSIFCDEHGNVTPGDRSGAVLLDYILSKERGIVVTPINSSIIIDKIVKKHGGNVIRTKVGSVEVSRKMIEVNAIAGLEENGGFMYGKHIPVRDGAMSSALMLEALASTNKKYSELLATLPRYYSYKTKFTCEEEYSKIVIDNLKKEPYKIEVLDGVKIWFDEDTWLMVRKSGTEPIIRLYAESNDNERLKNIVNEYSKKIIEIISK